jgi:hypothetical protein
VNINRFLFEKKVLNVLLLIREDSPSSNLVCVITLSVSNRSVEIRMNVYTDYARFKTCNFLLEFALNAVNIFLEPSKMHISLCMCLNPEHVFSLNSVVVIYVSSVSFASIVDNPLVTMFRYSP